MVNELDIEKKFVKEIKALSTQELKELLLINTYKLAVVRAQLDAIMQVLIKNKLASYEELWKKTNEVFNESVK